MRVDLQPEKFEARRLQRAQKIVHAGNLIASALGREPAGIEAMQTCLINIAETAALWHALMDKGLVTENTRQDYLDGAVEDLLRKTKERTNYGKGAIVVAAH